jgi:hypothetical protein
MGLDQWAYIAAKDNDHHDNHQEFAYWRKHPNLQGWMEKLWLSKGKPNGSSGQEEGWGSGFNGIELELTWDDVVQLEQDILNGNLPHTQGFFFGNPSDDYYRDHDLDFCKKAKAELFLKRRVFYNSSW